MSLIPGKVINVPTLIGLWDGTGLLGSSYTA